MRMRGILPFILCALMLAVPRSALAQSGTSLNFEPVNVSAEVDHTVHIGITVLNGSAVNAFDITITYDPAILKLESWSFGDYLSNLMPVHQENNPGKLNLAATQLGRPGVSGNGTLINLVFRAVSTGSSTLILQNVQLVTGEGMLISTTANSGQVNVISGIYPTATTAIPLIPSLTPTLTATQMEVTTPTLIRTILPSSTPLQNNPAPIMVTATLTPMFGLPSITAVTGFGSATSADVPALEMTPTPEDRSETMVAGTTGLNQTDKSTPIDPRPAAIDEKAVNSWLWIIVIILVGVLIGMIVAGVSRKKKK